MLLIVRMVRALRVFGLIFLSYLWQWWMTLLLSSWERDPATGRDRHRVPRWLVRRRERLDERNAKRLLRATLRLRGVYIKLGQVLSIMGGLLPRVYQKELEQLQDQVPPRPFEELEDSFFRDFGRPASELYARIERQPLAAASLGQVHVAYLEDGTKLAVKVLYPGIRGVIAVDMQVIKLALIVYQWFVPVSGLDRAGDALVDLLERETNYEHEAEMMTAMAENFAHAKDILFPEVVPELTSRDVLTMTFMEGMKISKVEAMPDAGIDPHAVACRLVECFYEQLFVHRLFHADPHPGNFLVQPGRRAKRPKIVILDFGAISTVEQSMVDGMVEILQGIFDQDRERLMRGFYQMGFASKGADHALLERTVEMYFEKLMGIQDRSPGALMNASQAELEALADPEIAREQLRDLMKSFDYPEGWFYVERASILMFWLVAQIDPHVDAMRIGFPFVMPLLMAKRAEEAAG